MKQPVYYSQYDEPYASFPYPSANHPKANVKSSGCGVTCFAMIHATLLNSKYTPVDGAKDAITMNDRGLEGTEDEYYAHAAAKYKLPFSQITDDEIKKNKAASLKTAIEALKSGKLVVCRMKDWFRQGAGHFVLAWGITGGKIQICDPASRANTGKLYEQSVFAEKCIGYFIFGRPEAVMTYNKALKIIDQYVPIDEKYWDPKANIDQYFDDLIIKFAKFLKEKG